MTHEETIKRIQELVPGTVQTASHLFKGNNLRCSHCGATSQQKYDGIDCTEKRYKPITLAVVLMAIQEAQIGLILVSQDGRFHKRVGVQQHIELGDWNLSKDNFNDQSEETKAFISNLLK